MYSSQYGIRMGTWHQQVYDIQQLYDTCSSINCSIDLDTTNCTAVIVFADMYMYKYKHWDTMARTEYSYRTNFKVSDVCVYTDE